MDAKDPRFGRLPSIRLASRSGAASAVEQLERLLDDSHDGHPLLPHPVVSTSAGAPSRPSCDLAAEIRHDGGAAVLVVRGHLDLASATRLGAVLADLLDGRRNVQLEVDLRQSSGVDPAGLGVFDAVARIATRRNSRLSVHRPSDEHAGAVTGHRGHHHMVEFYESDELLGESVRQFVDPSLRGDEGVIVVATGRHRHLFESALEGAGIDVAGARATDRYIDCDAGETLARFMSGGVPDPDRFAAVAAGLMARAGRGGRPVRIYGEMVAVLWAEGNIAAAIALEDLWNDLARRQPFSLLCAYPLTAFDHADATESFRTICEQHAPPPHPVPA